MSTHGLTNGLTLTPNHSNQFFTPGMDAQRQGYMNFAIYYEAVPGTTNLVPKFRQPADLMFNYQTGETYSRDGSVCYVAKGYNRDRDGAKFSGCPLGSNCGGAGACTARHYN